MSAFIAPELDEIQLSSRADPGGLVRSSARPAAAAFSDRSSVPPDEFLNWFLEVSRSRSTASEPDRRRMAETLAAGLPTLTPLLPEPTALASMVMAWAEAHRDLAALLRSGTPVDRALGRWAGQLLMSGESSRAVEAFRAAAALDPQDALSWTNLGVAYDVAGSAPESAACLEHSLRLRPVQPDTWLQLGLVRRKQGDAVRAEAAYRAALEQAPLNALAWQCLALLKEEQRDFPAAIDCLAACLAQGGGSAPLHANLGRLCYRIGRLVEAHQAYAEALRLEPTNTLFAGMERKLRFICCVYGGAATDDAVNSLQADGLPRLGESELRELCEKAFGLLAGFGHTAAALRVARYSIGLWPAQPTLSYLVKAMEGGSGVDRSPEDYLVEHFDRFADQFEHQLVGALGYDVPEQLHALLRMHVGNAPLEAGLDAGCGTGLCSPFLRPMVRHLTGVDISPRMLAHAAGRETYNRLVRADLIKFLGRTQRAFDLITAADVMIYFGELGPLLWSAAYALRRGGWLAFSTETVEGDDFVLRSSGRFAHSAAYVHRMAEPEFTRVASVPTTIRLEGTTRVPGRLFLFRRA